MLIFMAQIFLCREERNIGLSVGGQYYVFGFLVGFSIVPDFRLDHDKATDRFLHAYPLALQLNQYTFQTIHLLSIKRNIKVQSNNFTFMFSCAPNTLCMFASNETIIK